MATQPLGASTGINPWWVKNTRASEASASARTTSEQSVSALLARATTGFGVFPAAASDDDQAWLDKLVTKDGKSTDLLNQLTQGSYGAGSSPDYIAVRSGTGITGQFSGGFSVTGSVDGNGTDITYFSTGTPPRAMKGVAISFAPEASAKVRSDAIAQAQKYLTDHLDDAQNAHGHWNRPTFDVRV